MNGPFGKCLRCKRPWSVCRGHDTPYNSHGGACFPLCEECWAKITPQERWPYYVTLNFKTFLQKNDTPRGVKRNKEP